VLNLKQTLVVGTFWTLVGQFGYLAITLIANIVLARILSPSEYGQLGIVLFFIVIASVLSESGLGGALVRNNNATDVDYSTIFIFNLVISVFLCLLLISCSGYIADFYEDQSLKKLLIASSFVLVINAFQFVQSAKLVKQMRFKQKAIYEFIAILIAATIGIILALKNFGVWSLVVMQLLTSLILTLLLWFFEGGHGAFIFNKKSFKFHYRFGLNTTLASIINAVFDNAYQIILGKYFAIAQTGLYYQAKKLQDIPTGVINQLTQGLLFSVLSKLQDDEVRFKQTYQGIIRLFTIIVGFICLILFVFAKELILLLLGDQWVEATFFLQSLSIVGFFYMQEMFNRILFKVYNDTSYILYLEFMKKGIQLISIFIGLYANNIKVLMYGFIISSVLSYFINYYFVQKKYSFLGNNILFIVIKVFFIIFFIVFISFITDFESIISNIFIRILLTIILLLIGYRILNLINFKEDFNRIKNYYD
jgi:teichuronic acid exporter